MIGPYRSKDGTNDGNVKFLIGFEKFAGFSNLKTGLTWKFRIRDVGKSVCWPFLDSKTYPFPFGKKIQ